jgi:hypothetical protein
MRRKNFKKTIKTHGRTYVIKVSDKKNKKYTAWLAGPKMKHPTIKGEYIRMLSFPVHFGDKRYPQYRDKIGFYKKLDTLDKKQRQRYRKRHYKTNIHNPKSAAFWSWHYLW